MSTLKRYLFTQAGIFRAFSLPGFFLSTRRGSLVTQPAECHHQSVKGSLGEYEGQKARRHQVAPRQPESDGQWEKLGDY